MPIMEIAGGDCRLAIPYFTHKFSCTTSNHKTKTKFRVFSHETNTSKILPFGDVAGLFEPARMAAVIEDEDRGAASLPLETSGGWRE